MAHSLPERQKTGNGEDDFSTADDTSETTKLFQDRLAAWKQVCDNMVDYIKTTEKMQTTHAKEYEKVLKTISQPINQNNHFAQNLGGVSEMFENMKQNTHGISHGYADTARTLKSAVIPVFERIDGEIKAKQKELKKGAGKGGKVVDKARAATQKHVDLLGQYSSQVESGTAGKIDPSYDPYVLHRGIQHRLNKQIIEENGTRQEILGVQENFSQFESHIVQVFQQGMGQFYTAMAQQSDSQKQLYGGMVQTIQKQDPLFEWHGFVSRNNQLLIDPSAPPRTMQNVTFANQNHSTTQALCHGALERKHGLLKKWDASIYAITPAGFLHEFKSDDDHGKDPVPETSLYLPECTAVALNGTEITIKGKDVSSRMSLSGSKEYEFRARSDQDAETWWRIIREVCSGQVGSGTASPRVADGSASPLSPKLGNRVGSFVQSPTSAAAEKSPWELIGGEGGQTGKVVFTEEELAGKKF